MIKTYMLPALVGALLLGSGAAFAANDRGPFETYSAMQLAKGRMVQTDCTINGTIGGQMYCFGSQRSMRRFMKDPEGNTRKANAFYASMKDHAPGRY